MVGCLCRGKFESKRGTKSLAVAAVLIDARAQDLTNMKIDGVPQDVVAPQTAGVKAHVKRTKPDEL